VSNVFVCFFLGGGGVRGCETGVELNMERITPHFTFCSGLTDWL
jgi:hypothetical protein